MDGWKDRWTDHNVDGIGKDITDLHCRTCMAVTTGWVANQSNMGTSERQGRRGIVIPSVPGSNRGMKGR